jgi:hypothetical protein
MSLYYIWFDPELKDNCAMEALEMDNKFVKLKNTLISEGINLQLVQADNIMEAQKAGNPVLHMVAGEVGSKSSEQLKMSIYKNQTGKH